MGKLYTPPTHNKKYILILYYVWFLEQPQWNRYFTRFYYTIEDREMAKKDLKQELIDKSEQGIFYSYKLVELEYKETTTVEELYPLNLPFESGVNPLVERKNNGYSNDDYKYILKKFRKDLDYCTKLVNANKSRMTTDDYYRQMYCTIARYYKRLPLNFKYRSDGCIFGLFSKVTEKDSVENYLKQLDDFEKQLI
jgi:hypothetical protein